MEFDLERIQEKIAYIKEQVSDVREIINKKEKHNIVNDKWLLKGIKYFGRILSYGWF